MLEKERFLAIKKLANKISKDNEDFFTKMEKVPTEDAIQEKEEFIESIIDSLEIEFSEGEQGREEKQIFRANILLPDDTKFFNAYSKDKNIRNLMNKFSVGIEDIMSKITELNIYGQYADSFEENDDFVDEMVNISSEEAENLLDEIEDLSSVMESLNIPMDNIAEETPKLEEAPKLEETPKSEETPAPKEKPKSEKKKAESKENSIEEDLPDFDNISNVVSGFVNEYGNLQKDLEAYKANLDEATEKISKLQEENESLKKNNLEAVNSLKEEKDAKNRLEAENVKLQDKLQEMENKLKQTSAFLKKIYNSIPRNK